jgi:RNA polymerase sigma-70 factor, ECF subfamily
MYGRSLRDNRPVADAGLEGLLEAARQGDADALDALLRRYQPHVHRFGLRMCRDPERAQEVLQETLLAAARTVHRFRGDSSLSTWLYTIARSFCIKSRRRRASEPDLVSLESEADAVGHTADARPGPERQLADQEVRSALEEAIAALEPEYREVLVLRDTEGLPAAEVAEVTGLSVAAVKSRLHRARRFVRDRLAPLLTPTPGMAPGAPGVCPDVVDVLSRHLEGEIAPDACAEMERHVEACPHCRGACESLRQTLRLCGSTPLPEVSEAVQQAIREGIRNVLAEKGA